MQADWEIWVFIYTYLDTVSGGLDEFCVKCLNCMWRTSDISAANESKEQDEVQDE